VESARAANWASEKSGKEILRYAGKNFSGLGGTALKLLVVEVIGGVVFSVQKNFSRAKMWKVRELQIGPVKNLERKSCAMLVKIFLVLEGPP